MSQDFLSGEARGPRQSCQPKRFRRRAARARAADRVSSIVMELFWWATTLVLMALGNHRHGAAGRFRERRSSSARRFCIGSCWARRGASAGGRSVCSFCSRSSPTRSILPAACSARDASERRVGECAGAVVGAIVGLFFSLPGLLIGPIVGAVAGELIGGKRLVAAGRAGWGTLLGNLAALPGKIVIAFAMVACFLVAAPTPF